MATKKAKPAKSEDKKEQQKPIATEVIAIPDELKNYPPPKPEPVSPPPVSSSPQKAYPATIGGIPYNYEPPKPAGGAVNHPTMYEAFMTGISLPTEAERMIAIVNLIRGFHVPYKQEYSPQQYEGYQMALQGIVKQRTKVIKLIQQNMKK